MYLLYGISKRNVQYQKSREAFLQLTFQKVRKTNLWENLISNKRYNLRNFTTFMITKLEFPLWKENSVKTLEYAKHKQQTYI